MTPDPINLSAQNCPRPEDSYVSNGKFKVGQPDEVKPGETFTIECFENYELDGSQILTCESGTVFEEKVYPKCNRKYSNWLSYIGDSVIYF